MKIKHEKIKLLICMVAVFILYGICNIGSYPLHTSTDELGGIAGAAWLAGLDWSGVISNSGYYGFGWNSLFFWTFKLTDNPIIIYNIIIITNIFIRTMIIPVAFYIGKNHLKVTNTKMLYCLSVLMPFMTSQNMGIIANEYIFELLIWITMLLLCKIMQRYNNVSQRYFYVIVLFLLCLYSMTIHTRALTVLISVTIVLLSYGILKKDKKFVILSTVNAFTVYSISRIIISYYQMQIYGSGNNLTNATVQISSNYNLFSLKTWSVWLHMIIGMLATENILTGGIFVICIVILLFYLKRMANKQMEINPCLNVIFCVSILCIGATILAFLLSGWFDGMLSTWAMDEAGNNYSYKGLTYVRYWNVYLPPLSLCALSLINTLEYKKVLNASMFISIGLYGLFSLLIIPIIQNNASAFSPFYGVTAYKLGDVISSNDYYKCLLYSLIISGILYVLIRARRWQIYLLPIIIFMLLCQIRQTYDFDQPVRTKMSSKIMASYNEKCKLENSGTDIGKIYLYDSEGGDANWKIYSIAQFYFNRYTLLMGLPDTMGKNDIIISPFQIEGINNIYENILCYKLDEDEIWYTYMQLENK